jgi:hypothetical protein
VPTAAATTTEDQYHRPHHRPCSQPHSSTPSTLDRNARRLRRAGLDYPRAPREVQVRPRRDPSVARLARSRGGVCLRDAALVGHRRCVARRG